MFTSRTQWGLFLIFHEKNSTLYSGASLEKCWASLYKHCAFVATIAPPKMLAFKYLKCIYFLGPPLTPAAPALLLWRVKLPLNVMGTDEYYDVRTHQAKLSKCFEKMDYLRPGQTCDIYIIPILKWRGDHCPRSVRKAGAELVGGHLASPFPMSPVHFHDIGEIPVALACCLHCDITVEGADSHLTVYPRGGREKSNLSLFQHRYSYLSEPSLENFVMFEEWVATEKWKGVLW